MLDKVKNALRVKTAAFDDEIQDLIDACKADLRLVGVNVPADTPAEDSEKYRAAYDYLKCSLSLAGDYHALG